MKKLKRVVIKEELVELTGDFKLAIVLGQMIYWCEKVKDIDAYIVEEKERYMKFGTDEDGIPSMELSNGWIYKKAEELSDETMIGVKPKAMRTYLKELVDKGWLDQRRNPKIKMDRVLQYRVNIAKIQKDLLALGYNLDGYSINLGDIAQIQEGEIQNKKPEQPEGEVENTKRLKENSNSQKENRRGEKDARKGEKEKAIPEITTETTTEILKEDAAGKNEPPVPYKKIQDMFNETCDKFPQIRKMTAERQKHIKARFREYGNRIEVFEELFEKISGSKYLADNSSKWADFDWFMKENNMAKVLEGKYDKEFEKKEHKQAGIDYSKNTFHFKEQRSQKYSADEFEAMILENQAKKFRKKHEQE